MIQKGKVDEVLMVVLVAEAPLRSCQKTDHIVLKPVRREGDDAHIESFPTDAEHEAKRFQEALLEEFPENDLVEIGVSVENIVGTLIHDKRCEVSIRKMNPETCERWSEHKRIAEAGEAENEDLHR